MFFILGLEVPPITPDQVNLNTVLIAVVAALVTLLTPVLTALVTVLIKKSDRAEDRADRAAVAAKVEKVAEKAEETDKKLEKIVSTVDGTHVIVNSQRTVMLRQISVMARLIANDHPKNKAAQAAAKAAAKDLEENIQGNEAAAVQKLKDAEKAAGTDFKRAEAGRLRR